MSCSGTLDKELRRVLQQILPPGEHQYCADHVATTMCH